MGGTAQPAGQPRFSLVVPVFDEQDNVVRLLDEVDEVLSPHGPFEVLLVDDGSRDQSFARMLQWKDSHRAPWLRLVRLAQNGGQSAAFCAGLELARAPVVLMMDGDLQNDPRDLPPMLGRIEQGECDGVSGIRVRRRDSLVRRLSSRLGNWFRNRVTGDRVSDSASGIKAFRRELLLRVPRFKGMHRFLPTLARFAGGRVVEMPVNHRPRVAGQAKYGIGNRALRGLRDCFAVRWYRQRLIHFQVREER